MNTHYALLPGSRDPRRLLREAIDAWDGGSLRNALIAAARITQWRIKVTMRGAAVALR